MKTCRKCAQTKPLTAYGLCARGIDGYNPRCKECITAECRARYLRNRAHLSDTGEVSGVCRHCETAFTYIKTTGHRRFYCSERCRYAVATERRLNRPKAPRECQCGSQEVAATGKPTCLSCRTDKRNRKYEQGRRLSLYSMTQDDFDEMLSRQQDCCAICGSDTPGVRGWQIDHDHSCCPGTGSCGRCVRGLLCNPCNLVLGLVRDSPERLYSAQQYLLRRTNILSIPDRAA